MTYYFSTSGGRTENVENSFLGAEPAPYLRSVADPYDTASPRHRWTVRMTLGQASARLGGLVKGYLRQIRVLTRGRSPRVVRAQVVGTRGRTSVTGPQLRAKLGLYDTWARFTVITASATRGDGNTPAPAGRRRRRSRGPAAPSRAPPCRWPRRARRAARGSRARSPGGCRRAARDAGSSSSASTGARGSRSSRRGRRRAGATARTSSEPGLLPRALRRRGRAGGAGHS